MTPKKIANKKPTSKSGSETNKKTKVKAAAISAKIKAEMPNLSPELYQLNSFRLLGLPITSSLQEVESAAEKLAMMKELGMKKKGGNIVPLPMNSKVGEAEVSQAIQKLRDPFKRIVQELFWYHPEDYQEDGKGLKLSESYVAAYKQLLSKNYDGAAQIWLQETKSPSTTRSQQALHNLAVLYHSRALGEEANLEKDKRKRRNLSNKQLTYWRKALQFWHSSWKGWRENKSWGYLKRRVNLLQDPRLKPAGVRTLHILLPEALLSINAQLISRYISSGYLQHTGQHIELLRKSPFGKQAVKKACRTVLDPLKEKIKALCKRAEERMEKDSSKGENTYSWLYTNVQPLVHNIKKVNPKNILSGEIILDEVANSLRSIAVTFANNTKNYKKAGFKLREARDIAASPSIKKKIDEDIDICKHQEVEGVCWFCQKNPPDESNALIKPMHKVIERQRIPMGYDYYSGHQEKIITRYKTIELKIPRCKQCNRQHNYEEGKAWLWIVFLGLVSFIVIIILKILQIQFIESHCGLIGGAIIFLTYICIWGFNYIIERRGKTRGIKPSIYFQEFPLYKDARNEGFKEGEKPAN